MTIYNPRANYRKIWESHYGPIPKDQHGRSYEIHHIDGNRGNNDLANLACVTIDEHYDIHMAQGDEGACIAIELRRSHNMSSAEISERVRRLNFLRMAEGTHPFFKPDFVNPFATRDDGTNIQTDRVTNGTHHLLGGTIQSAWQQDAVRNGTHNFLGGDVVRQALENGTHASQILITCVHCRETHSKAIFMRDHGDKCHEVTSRAQVAIDGVVYSSKKTAAQALGVSEYQVTVLAAGKKPRPTFTYNGKTYRSIRAAMKETGLSHYLLTKPT